MKIHINQKNIPMLATLLVFVFIYLIGSLMYDRFFSLRVFVNLFIDNAFVGVIAVGMTFVIISGGIDLSVGSVVAFVGVLAAKLIYIYQLHPLTVFFICLILGAIFGFVMGSLIHFFELPPFLVTLVGMFLARGGAFLVSLQAIPIKHDFVYDILDFGIPVGFRVRVPLTAIIFLLCVIAGIYVLRFTKFGRVTYAIGSSESSAVLMGLPVGRTKILIYTLSGILSALGGIVYSIYTSSGYPLACVGLELDVIAAVVIGGTLLTGGAGMLEGTLIGVLILGLIQTFITFQGTLSSWWTKIVIGILLFIFILLQRYLSATKIKGKVDAVQPVLVES